MSLRSLINVRIVLSALFILLLGGAAAMWQAQQSVEKEVQSSFTLASEIVEFGILQIPVSRRYGGEWLPQLNALQQTRHLQISITKSQQDPVEAVNPIIVNGEKIPPRWFIQSVMTEYLTKEYTVPMADGSQKIISITADPMDEISEAWGEFKALFWSIVAMLGMIFLAINMVFHSMLQAMKSILAGLHQVELGKYDIALPSFHISEFDAIANEINKMSSALKIAQENNQALARHTMLIQESERKTMSRELHDEIGQSLTAIKAMSVTAKQSNVDISSIADSIIEICNHLAMVVRSMMRTLHPLSLAELGLGATLTDLVNEWHRRHADLLILMDYDARLESLDKDVAIHVYRVIQECLTNVVRHANAAEVTVKVECDKSDALSPRVDLIVTDNGNGGKVDGHGFGILAMRERVENLGGQFSIKSSIGMGTQVYAWIPFVVQKK